ncbi:MAG TPA: hemerythrin family protein [Bryobacteraceae bacterium]|nr:hemerythrin family protein [Bryobacteraceae bacterium]
MRFFHWRNSNTVFTPAIDDEHKTIFQATGEFQQALHTRAPLFQVQEILHRLIASTEDHFANEEKLMRGARYLAFDWHRQQHDAARKRLKTFAPLVEQGDRDAGHQLVEFLTRWLDDHTAVTDRMMSAYLRNQERARIR